MSEQQTAETWTILQRHFEAVDSGNIDWIVEDYAPDAAMFTPSGVVRGHAALRSHWEAFLQEWATRLETFELLVEQVDGEIAYIVWRCADAVPMATDTFVVRDGKIVAQTFAAVVKT